MKRFIALMIATTLISVLAGCADATAAPSDPASATGGGIVAAVGTASVAVPEVEPGTAASELPVDFDTDDLDASPAGPGATTIELQGDTVNVQGGGTTVNGGVITITSAGVYAAHGVLNDGQIIIDTQDQGTVRLVLNGAEISSSAGAPIYVRNADKTVITLVEGTQNSVTDAPGNVSGVAGSVDADAVIFSNDDLTINGSGSLTVVGNQKHGIASDDDLRVAGGVITVTAENDGLRGRDLLAVLDGTITVNAGSDALRASNDQEAGKGIVSIEGGKLDLTAAADGIQAETSVVVSGGEITIVAGGGSANGVAQGGGGPGSRGTTTVVDDTGDSARGLQAGESLQITDGTLDIDASDDGLHSDDRLSISGGRITLASGDDGLHAATAIEICGGELDITRSYEGVESAVITINGGEIHIVASDDGINASSGSGGAAFFGRQGPGSFGSGDNYLYVDGGYIAVDAMGDGLDINGPIAMTGGVVLVNGPTVNNNGALDYSGAFEITGGLLVAVGSAGMAMAPSESSSQYTVMVTFVSPLSAGTMLRIATEDGEEVLTFVPTKDSQSIVVSTPALEEGTTYVVYTGGSSSGTEEDGLYSGGTYSGGTQAMSFTVSGLVTGAGSYSGSGFPGGPGGRPSGPGGMPPTRP